jgi:hypothetical protein
MSVDKGSGPAFRLGPRAVEIIEQEIELIDMVLESFYVGVLEIPVTQWERDD